MIDKKIFNNKHKIFIAPYSSATKMFCKQLEEKFNIEVVGFIDSKNQGEGLYTIQKAKEYGIDLICIVSPNYGVEIYKGFLQKSIKKSQVKLFSFVDNEFQVVSVGKTMLQNNLKNLSLTLQKSLHEKYKSFFERSNSVLLLAPGFVDINIKALYLHMENHTHFNVVIATNNQEQYKEFKKRGFKIVLYPSMAFLYYSLKSKIKVLDHSPVHEEVMISLINSKIVQIWHGIALKKIGHLTNYKKFTYDLMVSTSDFVTEYSFSKIFNYKKIINAGYPRNDILVNGIEDDKELIMTDLRIYKFVKQSNLKVVIYMPTWRPYSHIQNPIDLDDLNAFAKEHNFLFIIKPHPFTRQSSFYDSTLDDTTYTYHEEYDKNLLFYPTTDDIYPFLALTDLLITDYSSVYFDYLLVNKPMMFFMYDKETYLKEHGDFMLDFEAYTPGEKPTSYEEFKKSILSSLKTDSYSKQRLKIRDELFEHSDGTSSKILSDCIKNLSLTNA